MIRFADRKTSFAIVGKVLKLALMLGCMQIVKPKWTRDSSKNYPCVDPTGKFYEFHDGEHVYGCGIVCRNCGVDLKNMSNPKQL